MTDLRQPSFGWLGSCLHAGSGGAGEEQGCSGERAAKASGESGGESGESAGIVDLSSKEPNMSPEELRM
jgi:hypothetical protein